MLGVFYRVTYAVGHNLIVYNLAIKLPVVAANIGLAYLGGAGPEELAAPRRPCAGGCGSSCC